jgi:hypothetical protein
VSLHVLIVSRKETGIQGGEERGQVANITIVDGRKQGKEK